MAAKKKSTAKSAGKKSIKVKDLAPKKDPKGGSTDHPPKGGGKRSDY